MQLDREPDSSTITARLGRVTSLSELLLDTMASRLEQPALLAHESGVEWTFGQLLARTGEVTRRLQTLGIGRGDPVALMMTNRPELHAVDAAAMFLGAVPFSVYNSASPEQIRYVLADSGARLLVVEQRFLATLAASELPSDLMSRILVIDEPATGEMSLHVELGAEQTDVDLAGLPRSQPDDVLTLIYTSGTTGPPKGVQLTHASMLAQLRGVHDALPLRGGGRQISFLPDAHVANRWASHYSALMTYANRVTTVADAAHLADAIHACRPTLFGAVPRVWEKLKALAEVTHGHDVADRAAREPDLAADVRASLGLDRAEWVNTGAAPTPPAVVDFFDALELPLCETFGMSETSCLVAMNTPDARRPGSVGRPLSSTEVALADDSELLIRGPQLMQGYRGLLEKTTEAIDADGWLHSGDIARLDDDGFLWIVDRKKEIIINSAGKNMSPANIEMTVLSAGSSISQICVIGDQRPYVVALVVPNRQAIVPEATPEIIRSAIQAQVDIGNSRLARVEQIKKFAVLDDEWRPGEELTPTMKLRRTVLSDRYGQVIDDLYASQRLG